MPDAAPASPTAFVRASIIGGPAPARLEGRARHVSGLVREREMIERTIQELRNVPELAKLQQEESFIGKVRQALGTSQETIGRTASK